MDEGDWELRGDLATILKERGCPASVRSPAAALAALGRLEPEAKGARWERCRVSGRVF